MPSWIFLALAAYAIMAFVAISDKYFLAHHIPSAVSYSFWVGVTGLVFALAIPFTHFSVPASPALFTALASGVLFTLALLVLFRTIELGDVSRVIPTMGAAEPVLTLVLACLFLQERLHPAQLAAFAILVGAGVLLSLYGSIQGDHHWLMFTGAIAAGLLFALSSVLAKYTFTHHAPFLTSFIWMRLAGGITAVCMLCIPAARRKVLATTKDPASRIGLLLALRLGAGLAFIMINYAIALGSVTLVNALKGVEYAVLFIGAYLLSRFLPGIVKEEITRKLMIAKFAAIAGIALGLWILT